MCRDICSLVRLGIVLLLLAFAVPAAAQSNACGVSGVGALTVDYDPLAPDDTVRPVMIQARCDAAFSIVLDTGASATFFPRTLRNGAAALRYNVYLEPYLLTVWGDGTQGTGVWTSARQGKGKETATLYVVIPAGQDVPLGAYSDQLTITVLP